MALTHGRNLSISHSCNLLLLFCNSLLLFCNSLKWDTLEKRREYFSLVECYKTVFGLNGIVFDDVLEYRLITKTRSNHNYTLYTKLPRFNCYKHSFIFLLG